MSGETDWNNDEEGGSGKERSTTQETPEEYFEGVIRKAVQEALQGVFREGKFKNPSAESRGSSAVECVDQSAFSSEIRLNAKPWIDQTAHGNDNGKEVRHLLRDLKGPAEGFDPRTEAQFDDMCELWQKQAKGFGYEPELLKFAIPTMGVLMSLSASRYF
jgi:hypothetical protein